ncbi:MAG: DHA2 family efflux MFS transporter permease subunit [Ktedonobacteraceae bacterium]|nr:DHA2 family efflux MFS transporter permease subunit [Ktedonobacteraceae bacterium]
MSRPTINPKISVSVVFVAAMFMSIMDGTIVNVALPALSRQFNAVGTSIGAVVVGYLVSLAIIIPASGWLGDRLGTKRIFLSALALFTAASALCGLATSLPMLIGFRILQGAGGGALTPVGTAILYRTFPPIERVQVSRILNIPTVFAPASGPVIGGLLIDKLSWHWVFYVNVPIGIAAFLFGILFLPEHREPSTRSFDLSGFLLAGIGLALTMYALSEGPGYGWTSASILSCLSTGLICIVFFIFVELRSTHPILDLRLFRNRSFRTCNLVSLFSTAGFLGLLYAAPLFLQEARGISALASGLTTFPEAVGVLVATQVVTRLYPGIGPRRLIVGGLVGVATVMALMCLIDQDTTLWLMRALMFLTGAGMAFSFTSVQAASFATISSAETGQAAALFNAQRQIGASLGVALLSSVISAVGMTQLNANGTVTPNISAYHAAFIASAVLAITAACIGLTVRDSDAAATMRRRVKQDEQRPALVSEPVHVALNQDASSSVHRLVNGAPTPSEPVTGRWSDQ